MVRLSYDQFTKDDKIYEKSGSSTISGGDHWVMITSIKSYDIQKNTITFEVYDDHGGSVPKTMSLDKFKDMTNHVIMVEKK